MRIESGADAGVVICCKAPHTRCHYEMQLGNSLLSHSAKAGIQVVNSGLAAAFAEVVAEKDRTRRMLKFYFEFPSEKKFQAKVDR